MMAARFARIRLLQVRVVAPRPAAIFFFEMAARSRARRWHPATVVISDPGHFSLLFIARRYGTLRLRWAPAVFAGVALPRLRLRLGITSRRA